METVLFVRKNVQKRIGQILYRMNFDCMGGGVSQNPIVLRLNLHFCIVLTPMVTPFRGYAVDLSSTVNIFPAETLARSQKRQTFFDKVF